MDEAPPDPPGNRLALRAGLVVVVIGFVVALILQDNAAPPDPAPGPAGGDPAVAPSPTSSGQPTSPAPAQPSVPTPPPGLDDLVCAHLTTPVSLRVVTFNIHRAAGPSGSLATIAAEIDSLEPDVVLLQEVDRFHGRSGKVDQAARLAAATGMHRSYSANLVRKKAEYGTLILSRHEIVQRGRIPLHGRDRIEPRAVQWVTLDVAGRPVRVYNTHLEALRPRVRLRQARQLSRVVRSDTLPVIVGGDLNAWPGSGTVAELTSHLVDTWRIGTGDGATGVGGRRIDYLLVDRRFRLRRAEVLASEVSDHHRLMADVRLPAPTRCR